MNRRDMLKAGFAAGTIGLAPRLASAEVNFSPVPKGWRTFSLTTRVEPTFASKAWIPLPTFTADDWQRPGATTWTGNARVAEKVRDPKYGAEMLRVEWAADQQNPLIEVTTQVHAQNRAVRIGQSSVAPLGQTREDREDAPERGLLRRACALQHCTHLEVFEHGEVGKHLPSLGDVADACLADAIARPAGDVGAVEADGAARRRLDAVDGADQRALACAIGADDRHDFAGRDLERDAGQRLRIAVIEVEAGDLEQRRVHATSSSPR